jgi:hypothetical protein
MGGKDWCGVVWLPVQGGGARKCVGAECEEERAPPELSGIVAL